MSHRTSPEQRDYLALQFHCTKILYYFGVNVRKIPIVTAGKPVLV